MTISLEQSAYTVREAEGMVEVCAVVTQGMLAPGHSVSVQLSSMDGTAGELLKQKLAALEFITIIFLLTQWLAQTTPV